MTESSRGETIRPGHRHAIGHPPGTDGVRSPVASGIAIRACRHVSRDLCPWNVRFARELREPTSAARDVLRGRDARALACEILSMTRPELSAAFKGAPMKRAKPRGLERNAAVVPGNVGTVEHVPMLERALADPEPLVREHAAWALARLGAGGGLGGR